jgi:hypothetical protein
MVYIYILQLEQGKYYVGKTINPSFRLDSHFNSNGSAWTKLYKPIKMVELVPNCDDYDEDKYTRIFMDKYGVENVRGGSFVSIELPQSSIGYLTQMKNGTNDKCFNCGKSGHFIKDCTPLHISNAQSVSLSTFKNCPQVGVLNVERCKNKKEVVKEVVKEKDEPCTCPTSYFSRHRRSQCLLLNTITPTKTIKPIKEIEVWCCEYCNKEFSDKKKCEYHVNNCKYNNEEDSEDEEEENESEDECNNVICFRCGREGHYANSCYASKHIRGYYLK